MMISSSNPAKGEAHVHTVPTGSINHAHLPAFYTRMYRKAIYVSPEH